MAAVTGQGGLFHRNTQKSPPRSASQISAYRGQPSLQVLVFTTLKMTWSLETPGNVSPGDILASVPALTSVHLILHRQCHDRLFLEPSRGLWASQGCVWSQQALAQTRAGRDVTAASYRLSTGSGDEGHYCYIISLLNKTSEIFNLAVCCHVSWVQTALFYMSTCINIAIPSASG